MLALGSRWRTYLANATPWTIVVALLAAGFYSTLPVSPRDADAEGTEFSAGRAMEHLSEIAREPHPMGSVAIARVRDYIVAEVEALNLNVDLQTVPAPNVYGDGELVEVVNVIAWIPGTANTRAVVLMGHYDTFPTTPGANDDSAAVAAMLETARALRAGPPLANDIVFLFTDGEEPSARYGASAFAAAPGLLDSLGLVVNFEAVGGGGASTLVETSGPRSWLVGEFASAAPAPAAFSFLTEVTELIGEIGTDFDVFSGAGLPGMHFVYVRGSPIYHTADDDIDSVGRGSLQHHGDNALAIARHFGNMDLAAIPDSGSWVFFTIRPFFFRYPAVWGAVLAVAAAALLAWAISGRRRPHAVSPGGITRSAGAVGLGAVAGATAGTLVWLALAALRSSPAVLETYAYLAVVLSIGVLVARWVTVRVGRRSLPSRRHGRVALWVILALVTAIALPGVSYLFVWPALAAGAGLLWRPRRHGWAIIRFAIVAVPTLLLMTPAIDYLFFFAQPRPGNPDSQMTAAALVPLLLGLLVVGLLEGRWDRPELYSTVTDTLGTTSS